MKKINAGTEKKIHIEKLKGMSIKEIALLGNISPVVLVLSDCDIEEYLKYRIMLINDRTELEELKSMYKTTEWWKSVISNIKKG